MHSGSSSSPARLWLDLKPDFLVTASRSQSLNLQWRILGPSLIPHLLSTYYMQNSTGDTRINIETKKIPCSPGACTLLAETDCDLLTSVSTGAGTKTWDS